jgi:excisionase family DNA binding protein
MFKDYPEILTPKEAMTALGVGKNTMYRLLNTGEIRATRVGGKIWRISRKALTDYVKTQNN